MLRANRAFAPPPDPLGLFFHAHVNGVPEAERCVGLVEKSLLANPRNPLLTGCKAALLMIVHSQREFVQNAALLRRKSLDMAMAAMLRDSPWVALQIAVANGLAWARPDVGDIGRLQALVFLQAMGAEGSVARLPPPLR